MSVFQNVITMFVLSSLVILGYCKWTHKTLLDVFREFKEMLSSSQDVVKGGAP